MAFETTKIADWKGKVMTKTTFWSIEGDLVSNKLIVDPDKYDGFISDTASLLDMNAVSWSIGNGDTNVADESRRAELRWKNYTFVNLRLSGNGSYGGSDGLPKIPNDVEGTPTGMGNIRLDTNVDAKGFMVCIWDKVGDWTGPPAAE